MADRVEFNCPHCNQLYRLTADQLRRYAGRTAHCRKCQQPFTFPDASIVEAIAQEQPEPEPEPARDASASMFGGTAVAGTAVATAASTLRDTLTRPAPASRLESGPVIVSVPQKQPESQEEPAEQEQYTQVAAPAQPVQAEIPIANPVPPQTMAYHRPRALRAPFSLSGFLAFRDYALPALVQVVFWGGLLWCVYFGYQSVRLYLSMPVTYRESTRSTLLIGLSVMVLGPIVLRLLCEIASLLLRISRTLDDLRDASDRQQS